MAVGIVTSAKVAAAVSVGSFNFSGSLGTGGRAGLVFVVTYANVGVPIDTGVTWNTVAMTPLYVGADTNTEPAAVKAYFLDNISNGTVTVSRTNNTVVCSAFAVVISAASATIVSLVKTVGGAGTVNTNASTSEAGTAASGEVALDDGSPGTNSMRFAVVFTGAATPLGQGTNSTSLDTDDRTAFGSTLVRETTAGQGSRSVGVATGTTDDYAVVAVAVSEAAPKTPQPTAASLTATGATPTVSVTHAVLVAPSAASLAASGGTPVVAVTDNKAVAPTAAALELSGATPTVAVPVAVDPGTASLELVGATPEVAAEANVAVSPDAAALALTAETPVVEAVQVYAPTAAALALTTDTPIVATPVLSQPTAAELAVAFGVPGIAAALTVPQASLILEGAVPTIVAPVGVSPTAAALAVAFGTPLVDNGDTGVVQPTPAALQLVGATPDIALSDNKAVQPSAATLLLGGAVPVVGLTANVTPAAVALLLSFGTPLVTTGTPPPPLPDDIAGSIAQGRYGGSVVPGVHGGATVVLADIHASIARDGEIEGDIR